MKFGNILFLAIILYSTFLLACSNTDTKVRSIEATAEARSLTWIQDLQSSTSEPIVQIGVGISESIPIPESTSSGLSLKALEDIGFKKMEQHSIDAGLSDIHWSGTVSTSNDIYNKDGLVEVWNGEININGKVHFLQVLIFDRIFGDIEMGVMMISLRAGFRKPGVTKPVKTAFTKNILIACYEEEVCSHTIGKLQY